MEIVEDVVVVGGGIAGMATAVALKRVGIRALVLERAEDLRTTGAALSLFPNAWLALDALGVSHKLTPIYTPFTKSSIHKVGTGAVQEVSFPAPTAKNGHGPRSVHRKALLQALAEELPVDSIRFSSKVAAIENQEQEGASIALAHLEDGTTIKSKVLIGCDGVHSVVTKWLGLAEPVESGRSAVRGLAVSPQGHGLRHEVYQFVDVGKRATAVPLNDIEIYWGLTFQSPAKGKDLTKDPQQIQRQVLDQLQGFPSMFLDVIHNTDLSTVTSAPLMFRYPWHIIFGNLNKGNVAVAGDAMHPMTPDLAQGGCTALEDAVVLGRRIGNSFIRNGRLMPSDVARALDGYVKERKWRVAWIVATAYFSGQVQQDGSTWWMRFLRDSIFYKYLFSKIGRITLYDCGKLPAVSYGEKGESKKED